MYSLVISLHVLTMLVALAYVVYWLPGLQKYSWRSKSLWVTTLASLYGLTLWWWH